MDLPKQTPVLVVGAGPSGLLVAQQLAKCGISCVLIERNLTTSKWPKMDLTNIRSMELFRPNRLDLGSGLRAVGVPAQYSLDTLFSTGLSDGGEVLAKWNVPSVDKLREKIKEKNDGSMPREPYQRCSQAVFEAWLQPRIQAEPLITSKWGCKLEVLTEFEDRIECEVVDVKTGERNKITSQYVIGCDGGGSRVRQSVGVEMRGGPVPGAVYMVHFKSRDLTKLHRQGQFWHLIFVSGQVLISQDEVDTWTIHSPIPLDTDPSTLDPYQAVYKGLGGPSPPLPIEIDEILVTSVWRPNIYLADKYVSKNHRVLLSGDSAHQMLTSGGYGMNTAVGDSFDVGWKVAAVLAGFGGAHLLQSYEDERRAVAEKNLQRSGEHFSKRAAFRSWVQESPGVVTARDEKGAELRAKIGNHMSKNDAENQSTGTEIGYRCNGSTVIYSEDPRNEPPYSDLEYIPSTWPGARAPHVYLKDGETSIFDLFGTGLDFTLVDFTPDAKWASRIRPVAEKLAIPLKVVHLPEEDHARRVWERDAVLVRPDDFVCWRAPEDGNVDLVDFEDVLLVVVGKRQKSRASVSNGESVISQLVKKHGFTGTIGNVDRNKVEKMATFQN